MRVLYHWPVLDGWWGERQRPFARTRFRAATVYVCNPQLPRAPGVKTNHPLSTPVVTPRSQINDLRLPCLTATPHFLPRFPLRDRCGAPPIKYIVPHPAAARLVVSRAVVEIGMSCEYLKRAKPKTRQKCGFSKGGRRNATDRYRQIDTTDISMRVMSGEGGNY